LRCLSTAHIGAQPTKVPVRGLSTAVVCCLVTRIQPSAHPDPAQERLEAGCQALSGKHPPTSSLAVDRLLNICWFDASA
jgi:hypothetical protein